MYRYLGDDVVYTARLWHDEVADAALEGGRVLDTHDTLLMPASVALARAEFAGAPIDTDWVQESIDLLDVAIARRRTWVEWALPMMATTPVTNVLSPQQIADVMYDEWRWTPDARVHGKIKDDDRSTDADHMNAAIAKYKVNRHRLERRRAWWCASLVRLRRDTKQRASLQKQLLDKVDADGRIRASFLLHGASTGRLSSREPNLQNMAAVIDHRDGRKPFMLSDKTWTARPPRMAFRARDGYAWTEVDFSQLELRVAAALSGDQAFGDIFRQGRDVHADVAGAIFSKDPKDVLKGERYIAKAVSFGVLYGRTAAAIAGGEEMDFAVRELGLTRWTEDQAQVFIDTLLRAYPDLRAWMGRQVDTALNDQYIETVFGRRRRFPFFTKRDHAAIGRQAINTPIQSAASDLCLQSLVQISGSLEADPSLDATIMFPVHDSICAEVWLDDVPVYEALCRGIMEQDFLGVPLRADFESGPTWAEVH
jgi:DNA polymerase-1